MRRRLQRHAGQGEAAGGGHASLAGRVSKASKARNQQAHPDVSLAPDIAWALGLDSDSGAAAPSNMEHAHVEQFFMGDGLDSACRANAQPNPEVLSVDVQTDCKQAAPSENERSIGIQASIQMLSMAVQVDFDMRDGQNAEKVGQAALVGVVDVAGSIDPIGVWSGVLDDTARSRLPPGDDVEHAGDEHGRWADFASDRSEAVTVASDNDGMGGTSSPRPPRPLPRGTLTCFPGLACFPTTTCS